MQKTGREKAPTKWFDNDTIFMQNLKKRMAEDPSLDYGTELSALAYGAFNSHVAWRLIEAFEEFNRCYASGDFHESARKRQQTLFKEAREKTSKGSQERLRLEKLLAPYEKHLSRIENENKENK